MDLESLVETKFRVKKMPSLKNSPKIILLQFSESSYLCVHESQG